MTKPNNEARQTQVFQQMENLKSRLSELETGMANVRDRLAPVLRNDTEDSEKFTMTQEALVPLASDIKASANRVNALTAEITALLQELEL